MTDRPAAMPRFFAHFLARYDGQALRPPDSRRAAAPPDGGPPLQAWQQLRAWCFAGVGDGARPLFRPGARPAVKCRLSVAVLRAGDDAPAAARLAEAFSLELDGTRRLLACGGRLAALGLRLAVKLREAAWWRPRRPEDPWDSGFIPAEAAGQQRLARFFQPRRATLVVAAGLAEPALLACIEALDARQGGFDQPVRLLVLAERGAPDLAARIAALPGRPDVTVLAPWGLQALAL